MLCVIHIGEFANTITYVTLDIYFLISKVWGLVHIKLLAEKQKFLLDNSLRYLWVFLVNWIISLWVYEVESMIFLP